MKKYITIAALLAAGSALASATEEILTLTSPSGGTLLTANQPLAWSEPYSKLTSWEISFTLTDNELPVGNAYSEIFGTRQYGGVSGFALKINSTGTLEVYTYKTNIPGFNDASVLTSGNWITPGVPTKINLSFVADINEVNQIVGGTFTLSNESGQSVSNKLASELRPAFKQTSLENNGSSKFYTNGAKETYADITVTKLADNVIPEPSTFGLLAGIGALALVGTRRRKRA